MPAPHSANADCGLCHPTMTPGDNQTIAYPALHIDGNLDVTGDAPCDSCHGSAGVAAPPVDVLGNMRAELLEETGAGQTILRGTYHLPMEVCVTRAEG